MRITASARFFPHLRLSLAWLVLGAASCSAFGPMRKEEPLARAEVEEDEDAGVERLTKLLRDFQRALDAKDFETARARLGDVELAMRSASGITRGHPDFEDLELRANQARPRFDEAVERDRIARRNAAIAELIRRGTQLIDRGKVLLSELARRVPEGEDMENLQELSADFTKIEKEGADFLEDTRYREHAVVRDQMMITIIGRRRQAEWQMQTSAAVGTTIEQAVVAVGEAKVAKSAAEQIAAMQRASEAFRGCIAAIRDAETLGGYEPSSVLTTKLGTLAITETKRRCTDNEAKMREQTGRLIYRERVGEVAKRVDAALAAVTRAVSAASTLAANEAALSVLDSCHNEVSAAVRGPGHDPAVAFTITLGPKLNGEKLARACEQARAKILRSLPLWQWRQAFETMKPGLEVVKQRFDEASGPGDAGLQIKRWQLVIENLGSCVAKAQSIGRERNADKRYKVATAFGELDVLGVEKRCAAERKTAEARLAQAVEAQSIETFAATCKGDEIAVVRREGVPAQVVPVEGGRLFVYGKRGPGERRFGFDAEGLAVDFAEKWRAHLVSINGELVRVIKQRESAKAAAAALAANKDALPVLEVCTESLTGTERHPGYDPKARFATPLGKLSASELRAACQKRRAALEAEAPRLAWRAELEALAERVTKAEAQAVDARQNPDANTRVKRAGEALGGLRECVERAEVLARKAEVDKKAKVATPFGVLDVVALGKACNKAIGKTEGILAEALAAQKLERFLTTCKADELAVAKREGLPDRVDVVGSGRVFVYEGKGKKSKTRRFAFDASGARVEEAVLRK